jgi:hypothetical protein
MGDSGRDIEVRGDLTAGVSDEELEAAARLRPLRRMPNGVREAAGDPLQLGKHPVAAFVMQLRKRIGKICVVIHELPRLCGSSCFPFVSVKNFPATSSEETIVP